MLRLGISMTRAGIAALSAGFGDALRVHSKLLL